MDCSLSWWRVTRCTECNNVEIPLTSIRGWNDAALLGGQLVLPSQTLGTPRADEMTVGAKVPGGGRGGEEARNFWTEFSITQRQMSRHGFGTGNTP